MKKTIFIPCILLVLALLQIGTAKATDSYRVYKFWVEFKDKKGSSYSILRPWDFLSQRAINRRTRAGYSVGITDLPVNQKYLQEVGKIGVEVKLSSRWMNATLVSTKDSSLAKQLADLGFVSKVTLMGVTNRKRGAAETDPILVGQDVEMAGIDLESSRIEVKNKVSDEDYNDGYGLGWKQISMMNGQYLHKAGYKGEGVYIAVLDAGFYRANRISAFDSLFQTKRFLGSKDLVDIGSDVFNDDDHGTHVLSCLASNVNGVMTGTAPNASYLLIRTEDAGSETPAEEIQWLCGAEYADSVGIDMISSSLGYTEFDDKSFGHHYNELNGYTTLITRAANLAWERGMVIVNSAGNEGDADWKYIGAPADAMGVIAVGAVDENGYKADFSSFGPTADNRIKPDLVALGQRTTVVNSNGYYIRSNGTSYSAPVLAGAVACLIQANMDKSPAQIRKILMLSSSQYLGPDSKTGHGLPDFELALAMSKSESKRAADNTNPFLNLPKDSISTAFDLRTTLLPLKAYTYKLYNQRGGVEESGTIYRQEGLLYTIRISPKKKGKYSLEIADGEVKWNTGFYFESDENK